jgi:hypothetical protein
VHPARRPRSSPQAVRRPHTLRRSSLQALPDRGLGRERPGLEERDDGETEDPDQSAHVTSHGGSGPAVRAGARRLWHHGSDGRFKGPSGLKAKVERGASPGNRSERR